MNLDPMMVMQGTYILKGKLGMYTSFAISLANSSGVLKGGIRYKVEGSSDNLKVTAYSNLKANDEEISYTISMSEAKAEGWTSNAKYKSLPELMLRYRAATLLIRTHIPQVLNGLHTVEELKDVEAANTTTTLKDVSSDSNSTNRLDAFLDEEIVNTKVESLSKEEKDEIVKEVIEEQVETENRTRFCDKVDTLDHLIELHQVPQKTVDLWLQKAQVNDIIEMKEEYIDACIDYVKTNKTLEPQVAID